ncbi:hypothetical protein UFOVP140_33 [uncultured Caudovirales phage]|uniref:Uncharacterized protein n=1 Tax=uncultured Caudovirales phage TaxID=2100421 RepID=A0A6J5LG57_9CAUD|nr:hypothetical protein UFOVP140_33 [uncultured Caudovirales phage]
MSLPRNVVDRLFDRLMATYGRTWLNLWEGLDSNAIKAVWGHELAPYAGRLKAIAWALEHLPPRAPNVIEFKALCRQAPLDVTQQLPPPIVDPELVDAEIIKMAAAAMKPPTNERGQIDHKRWARRLQTAHGNGMRLSLVQVKAFQTALDAGAP